MDTTTEVRDKIEKSNAKYKANVDKQRKERLFEVGDQVMVFLRKERIPIGKHNKLSPKKYDPYKIIQKINDNAYIVELPREYDYFKDF